MTRPISKRDISQALYAKAEEAARSLQETLTPPLTELFHELEQFHAAYGIFPSALGINLVPPELLAMLISADSLAKPAKKAAKTARPIETAEPAGQEDAAKPARRRKTSKVRRATKKSPSEKTLPVGEAKPFILDVLRRFNPGDRFKNADVYEHTLQLFTANQGIDREAAKARFPYKILSLAMSTLKGVKRDKIKGHGTPPVVVYTASQKMFF